MYQIDFERNSIDELEWSPSEAPSLSGEPNRQNANHYRPFLALEFTSS